MRSYSLHLWLKRCRKARFWAGKLDLDVCRYVLGFAGALTQPAGYEELRPASPLGATRTKLS